MAVICLIGWIVTPLVKLVQYLGANPRLERNRPRALAVCAGVAALLVVVLEIIPFPNHFRAPGILQAAEHTVVVNESPGCLETVLARPGSFVKRGQPLLQMRDRELDFEHATVQAQRAEVEAMELRAREKQTADLKPLHSQIEAINRRLEKLEVQRAALTVRAAHDGQWVAPELDNYYGAWVPRGSSLGLVINERAFYFSAIISQREASRLFTDEIRSAQVRLAGQAGVPVLVTGQKIIPAEHQTLPSAALGWRGGGEVPVSLTDPEGTSAVEPFFELRATIATVPVPAILHGRSGKIRFDLAPEPLLEQWLRQLRQLLQKQYGL